MYDMRYRDEKPFIDAGVDIGGWFVFSRRNFRSVILIDAVWRVCHCHIHTMSAGLLEEIRIDVFGYFCFSGDETFPCFVAFFDDFQSIFFILAFPAERKRILLFSIRNLHQQLPPKDNTRGG
jgi:hypothetical protein